MLKIHRKRIENQTPADAALSTKDPASLIDAISSFYSLMSLMASSASLSRPCKAIIGVVILATDHQVTALRPLH